MLVRWCHLSAVLLRVSRDTVLREVGPGAGFETVDFVTERLGGGYRRTTPLQSDSSSTTAYLQPIAPTLRICLLH